MRLRGLRSLLGLLLLLAPPAHAALYYLIVGGLGGEPEYAKRFAEEVAQLAAAAKRTTGNASRVIVLDGDKATREALRARLASLAGKLRSSDRLAVFLIGHGSYDGQHYKFNLPGPDIDGEELGRLLAAVPGRPQLLVDASSASGAALKEWSAKRRIVITATRNGVERNATRFAKYWAEALSSDAADTDKNGRISAKEAFDYASTKVADSYKKEGTLATEHAQLSGNLASRFDVSRLKPVAAVAATPKLERLNKQHAALEEQIAQLRLRKDQMPSDQYFKQLQALLVKLATVQKQIDAAGAQ
jgi:hypothetical protein